MSQQLWSHTSMRHPQQQQQQQQRQSPRTPQQQEQHQRSQQMKHVHVEQQSRAMPQWQQLDAPPMAMASQMMYPPMPPQRQVYPGQSPPWGMPPPMHQGGYGQQGCCDQPCCGPPGQPGPCDCCFAPTNGTCCLCCGGGGAWDPYCCGPPTAPTCTSCMTSYCDWTYCILAFFTLMSTSAFITVMLFAGRDDIFKRFDAVSAVALDEKIANNIAPSPQCSSTYLLGISGAISPNDALTATVFALQISSWNLQRNILYFIAMSFTFITLLYAAIVSLRRGKSLAIPTVSNSLQHKEQQEEQGQQRRQQQQQEAQPGQRGERPQGNKLSRERDNVVCSNEQIQQQQSGGQPPKFSPVPQTRGPIELYGTPFYEFMRVAWFVMGVVVVFWACSLLISFWTFSSCYRLSTKGNLKEFFDEYHTRFIASVICVTIYLAWPLVNIFVECALWLAFFLPWIIFRSACKPGIGNLRPALPLDEVPGYIRLDMFFMDFGDIRRVGFSESAWKILTGGTAPFFSCYEDTSVDRDPTMSALLLLQQQQQYEWYARMQSVYPMGMGMQPPPSPTSISISAATNSANLVAQTANVSEEGSVHRRHRHSRSHSHSRGSHRRSDAGTAVAQDAACNSLEPPYFERRTPQRAAELARDGDGDNAVESPRRSRHRSAEGHGSRSRHRHRSRDHHDGSSRRRNADDGGETNGESAGGTRSRHRHHRRSEHGGNNNNNNNNATPTRLNNADLDRMLEEL